MTRRATTSERLHVVFVMAYVTGSCAHQLDAEGVLWGCPPPFLLVNTHCERKAPAAAATGQVGVCLAMLLFVQAVCASTDSRFVVLMLPHCRQGFDKFGYNRAGFDKEGYDKNFFDKTGYNKCVDTCSTRSGCSHLATDSTATPPLPLCRAA